MYGNAIEAFKVKIIEQNTSCEVLHSGIWARLFVEALDQIVTTEGDRQITCFDLSSLSPLLPHCALSLVCTSRDSPRWALHKEAAAYSAQPVRVRLNCILFDIRSLRNSEQGNSFDKISKAQLYLTEMAVDCALASALLACEMPPQGTASPCSTRSLAADWKLVAEHINSIGDNWMEIIDMPESFWSYVMYMPFRFDDALKQCETCMAYCLRAMITQKSNEGVEEMLPIIERMTTVAASTVRIIPFINEGKEWCVGASDVAVVAASIANVVGHYIRTTCNASIGGSTSFEKETLEKLRGNPQVARTFETAIKCATLLASRVDSELLTHSKMASAASSTLLTANRKMFMDLVQLCALAAVSLDFIYKEEFHLVRSLYRDQQISESPSYPPIESDEAFHRMRACTLAVYKMITACLPWNGLKQIDLCALSQNFGDRAQLLGKVLLPEEAAVLCTLRGHLQPEDHWIRDAIDETIPHILTPMTPERLIFRAQVLGTRRCAYLDCNVLLESSRSPRKSKLCSGCRVVRYCCIDCQYADWKAHRKACKELRREADAAKECVSGGE